MGWFDRPLTERYNNPGAIEFQPWMEKYGARVGPNGRYAAFDSPDQGYQVMSKLLDTYQSKHGLNTVSGIVNRWAPSNVDNNSTSTYTQKVAATLGVDPNAPLSPEQRPALMRAMASYEAGRPAPMPGQGAATQEAPSRNGLQPMQFPWNMVQWPTAADPTAGDLNPGMKPGPQVRPQPGMPGMFASIPPQDAPQAGPALPPPRGPEGPQGGRPPMGTGMGGMSAPAPQQSDNTPGFIQRMSMNPLVLGGIMTALDAARGGSGIEGFKAGAGTAAGIQDAWMKDYQLRQQIEKDKAVRGLLASGQGMDGVPAPLLAIAKATGDISPVVQHLTKQNGTDDIKEYEYAVRGGFQGSFQQWMEKKKNMAGEYAKQLVYGENAAGDIVPMQAGSKGDLTASKLPEGVKLRRDPIKFDAGTHYVLMDPTTRQQIGMVPKNVGEVSRQKEAGNLQGKAQGDLPAMESLAKDIKSKIDAVAKDPYLENMIGYSGYLPNVTPQARTLQAKIDQLKGQAFLQAFQSLKGAGAITEMEGAKATAAMARLQEMVQSGQDYREALKDFAHEVDRLLEVKRAQAAGAGQGNAAPAASSPGGGWSIQRVE